MLKKLKIIITQEGLWLLTLEWEITTTVTCYRKNRKSGRLRYDWLCWVALHTNKDVRKMK